MQLHVQPDLTLHPFGWYRTMRDHEPVWYDEARRAWHVFRYSDVARVLRDHHTFSSDRTRIVKDPTLQRITSILGMDEPRHHELRGSVSQAFTPRMIARLAPHITEIADTLIDAVIDAGTMDIVYDLAYPLSVTMIAELLGVPSSDRARFKEWSDKAVTGNFAMSGQQERLKTTLEIFDYFRFVMQECQDKTRQDLMSQLLAATVQEQHLTEDQLLAFCALLLVAGNQTTTCLISNAVWCFADQPAVAEQLADTPALLSQALEEVLRYYAPNKSIPRIAACDTMIGGQQVKENQIIWAWIGSANRDERQFPEPDRFDIRREPNRHLAFGQGIHFCMGAPLARMEARIALECLLTRIKSFSYAQTSVLQPIDSLMMFGPRNLPIQFVKR